MNARRHEQTVEETRVRKEISRLAAKMRASSPEMPFIIAVRGADDAFIETNPAQHVGVGAARKIKALLQSGPKGPAGADHVISDILIETLDRVKTRIFRAYQGAVAALIAVRDHKAARQPALDEKIGNYARELVAGLGHPDVKPPTKVRQTSRVAFGCLAWDKARQCVRGDEAAASMLGLTAQILYDGMTLEKFSRSLTLPDALMSAGSGSASTHHLRVDAAGGDIFHFFVSKHAGGWNAIFCRREATRAARDMEDALLTQLMQGTSDGFCLLDRQGRVVFTSGDRIATLSRFPGTQQFGTDWSGLWMGQGRASARHIIEKALENHPGQIEEYAFSADGTLHRWRARVVPISLPGGGHKSNVIYLMCSSRDMTASTQDQERLELASYAGAISGGWIWDIKARLLHGDPRMAATLAFPVGEMSSGVTMRQLLRRVAGDDRAVLLSALRKSLSSRGRLQCEFRVRAADGQGWIWVEADGRWETSGDGQIVGLPGILLNIDEKKRQALKREALLKLIDNLRAIREEKEILNVASRVMGETIEADRAAFADIDDNRDFVLVTALWSRAPQFAQLTRMATFQPFKALFDSLRRGEAVAVLDVTAHPMTRKHADVFLREKIRAFYYVPLMADGAFCALAMVHYAEPHRWDRINMGFILTVADRGWAAIRQNRAQEDLRRINGTLEEQVDRRTRERDSIWAITDDLLASVGLDGRLRHVNPSWARCADLDRAQYKGEMLASFVHPQDRQKIAEMLQALAANQGERSADLRLRFEDNSWHTFNWTGFRDDDEIFLIGRDITERIILEDQLRQSQKMEAVGQLTGGLAHDFNNILGGISGALGLMRRRMARGQFEGLDRYINAAQEATDRAAGLTHRLLAFSRRQTLDPTVTDVNELVSGLAEFLRRTIGPAVRLKLRLDAKLGPILIDRNQLENAILNLGINARDAMPEGGTVTISTRSDPPPKEGKDAVRFMCLTVADTGMGMTPEVMARAFDPFFTTKPIGKGTGLGLSMIYGFASQSGGRVEIESAPGAGTKVHIWLPLYSGEKRPAAQGAARRRSPTEVDLSHLRLLLVEDDVTLRFTLEETLRDRGVHVETAETGSEAMALLADEDRRYDVLMTDVGLPGGVNGRQLADEARARKQHLSVLFMTGYAEQTVFSDQSFDESMQILFKPFTTEMLDEKLNRIVEYVNRRLNN
ncbi:ATP-binding protein [Candidatus Kirkpatrickella diaphorinae]|uniref:histidine kinase n=1 Tax=Candidatus Kirkpatrickella diaphorinae TaxID=2984322 RepID=A0ABY6GJ33_9PROT|nr:ATP-binding protein [Candidatus Kirkpatrickella diaphorinae]UYH50701.1 ATP-binding protein [Candidatus Kirkpatrickella diaphorinae]